MRSADRGASRRPAHLRELTPAPAKPPATERILKPVHSEANRDSRPHLIGGHGDYVWETGKFSNPPETGLETWFIRGGSAGAALYTFRQPGIYAYLTHNLIEAVELGATAHFKVEGKWNDYGTPLPPLHAVCRRRGRRCDGARLLGEILCDCKRIGSCERDPWP
jgi:FtsP/CotA-like multicopper oxidase with cupredoxin domain